MPFVVKNLFGHGLPNARLRAAMEEIGRIAIDDPVGISEAKQIGIDGGAEILSLLPNDKQVAALQYELTGRFGYAQAIKESFGRIANQQAHEIQLSFPCDIQQFCICGCRMVGRIGIAHGNRLSTYGVMIFVIRQILAASISSETVKSFKRYPSRSASSATSIPTLFRNLKQSATVLAAE